MSFGITGRYARQTNYISPPGDFAAATDMPVGRMTDGFFRHRRGGAGAAETGGIVAFGDSLTDANISKLDATAAGRTSSRGGCRRAATGGRWR